MRPHCHLHLPDFGVGGTERWTIALAKELVQLDWRLSATLGPRLSLEAQNVFRTWERIKVEDIPQDAFVIAPCDFDILAPVSRRVIAVAHGMNGYYKGLLAGGGYFKGVAVSQIARQGFPPDGDIEVATLYNGVELDRLAQTRTRSDVRAGLGISSAALVIGNVGRWAPGKRPLAAAQAAAVTLNGLALYVGPHQDTIDAVRLATATADCRFVSPEAAEPIGDVYRAMDVCLISSLTEGYGSIIAEAWCCGVPVVATAVGIALEHPDLVTTIPQDFTRHDLAAAVRTALGPTRERRTEAARQVVLDRYTAAHMGEAWRSYLISLAAQTLHLSLDDRSTL